MLHLPSLRQLLGRLLPFLNPLLQQPRQWIQVVVQLRLLPKVKLLEEPRMQTSKPPRLTPLPR
jgi:hypothetical protein